MSWAAYGGTLYQNFLIHLALDTPLNQVNMACVSETQIDQPTADLILQLQRQDVDQLFALSKERLRKGKFRALPDEELALQLHNDELEKTSKSLSDGRMARDLAVAVQDGQATIAEAENQLDKRKGAQGRGISRPSTGDDEILAQPESSAWAAGRSCRPTHMHRCIACLTDYNFVNMVRVPCQHKYCRACFEALYKASITDESNFPPRCCETPIPIAVARIFLKSQILLQYEKKKIEYETPDKTYCSSTRCSAFIDPSHIQGKIATCPECTSTTCAACKERAHNCRCPADTGIHQLPYSTSEARRQRCHACPRAMELASGFNHMMLVYSTFFFSFFLLYVCYH